MGLGPGLGQHFFFKGAPPAITPLSWEVGGSPLTLSFLHLSPALKSTQPFMLMVNDWLCSSTSLTLLYLVSCMPEAPSIRATVVIGAGHLHTKSVWGGCLPVAAMGKVPVGDRAEVGLFLLGGISHPKLYFPSHRFCWNYEEGKTAYFLCVPGWGVMAGGPGRSQQWIWPFSGC